MYQFLPVSLHRATLILQYMFLNHHCLASGNESMVTRRGQTDLDSNMKTVNCIIESMGADDWEAVRDIYHEGIATGNATVETNAPAWERWNSVHRPDCRLVARDGDRVVGWAALNPVSNREAYSGVAEVSVYVADDSRGMGVGRLML